MARAGCARSKEYIRRRRFIPGPRSGINHAAPSLVRWAGVRVLCEGEARTTGRRRWSSTVPVEVGWYSRHAAALKRPEKLTVFRRIIAPLTIASIVAGCSSSTNPDAQSTTDSGNTPPVSAAQVNATPSLAFTPPTIALNTGGTVTFAFGSVAHNVF